MENLKSFYLRSQRDQKDFRAFFQINKSTMEYIFPPDDKYAQIRKHRIYKNFEERCSNYNIQTKDVKLYDELLQDRIVDIEKVIKEHFALITEVIEEEKQEKKDRDIEKTFVKDEIRQKVERLIIETQFDQDPDRDYENYSV